jgi:hypothetical protein
MEPSPDQSLPATPEHVRQEFKADMLQDACLVAIATIVCSLLAIRFEWAERFFAWSRRWESFEVDELAFVLLVLSLGLTWFSARRWRAAQRELERRLDLERAAQQGSVLNGTGCGGR